MINVSHKTTTLRTAKARAIVEMTPETAQKILNREVPKGDVLEFTKAAAMVGAKKTPELLLFCHNIPVEWVQTETEIQDGKRIIIDVTVQSTAKTGCEMEALTAASAAALTVYDMCKPIDKDMEIKSVKLLEKSGGKSQFKEKIPEGMKAGVLVISDSVFAEKKQDTAGKNILSKLREVGIENAEYRIVPDEPEDIRSTVSEWCESGYKLVITTGGTGLSPRDNTPEAVRPLIEKEIQGIMEAARNYGQNRTPYSMLSRGVSGLRGDTLILTLPGSSKGAKESMDALFPYVIHLYRMMDGGKH